MRGRLKFAYEASNWTMPSQTMGSTAKLLCVDKTENTATVAVLVLIHECCKSLVTPLKYQATYRRGLEGRCAF